MKESLGEAHAPVGGLSSFVDAVVELFALKKAERRARATSPAQRRRLAVHRAAGDRRVRSARRVSDPVAASILLRSAVLAYLRAAAIAESPERSDASITAQELASRLPPLAGDAVDPRPEADTERVRRALRSPEALHFDSLDYAEVELTRSALDRAATVLRGPSPRDVIEVRAIRVGRLAGCVLLATLVAFEAARARFWPNLAYGKPVTASAVAAGRLEGLVDGRIGTSYAVAASAPDNPWLTVDLLAAYAVTRINVYNRVDGYLEDSLPLTLKTSLDGMAWDEVARRETSFSHDPPWTVILPGKPARFVRVQSAAHAGLCLTELEVFGNPKPLSDAPGARRPAPRGPR
jgi:hypothetical protein